MINADDYMYALLGEAKVSEGNTTGSQWSREDEPSHFVPSGCVPILNNGKPTGF